MANGASVQRPNKEEDALRLLMRCVIAALYERATVASIACDSCAKNKTDHSQLFGGLLQGETSSARAETHFLKKSQAGR